MPTGIKSLALWLIYFACCWSAAKSSGLQNTMLPAHMPQLLGHGLAVPTEKETKTATVTGNQKAGRLVSTCPPYTALHELSICAHAFHLWTEPYCPRQPTPCMAFRQCAAMYGKRPKKDPRSSACLSSSSPGETHEPA